MIMKAEIIEVISSSNTFRVRIPTLHGDSKLTSNSLLPSATACIMPGFSNPYKKGDKVFIAFEDNDYEKPVILGRLYNKNSGQTTADLVIRSLDFNDPANMPCTAKLPSDTSVGNTKNLSETLANLSNLTSYVSSGIIGNQGG